MTDELIQFETAKLAKEKGFDLMHECKDGFHPDTGEVLSPTFWDYVLGDKRLVGRPTQSLLQKWLREVHELDIEIECVWREFKDSNKGGTLLGFTTG